MKNARYGTGVPLEKQYGYLSLSADDFGVSFDVDSALDSEDLLSLLEREPQELPEGDLWSVA